MSSTFRQFLYMLVVLAIIAFASFFMSKSCSRNYNYNNEVQNLSESSATVDTLWCHDINHVEDSVYGMLHTIDTLFKQVNDSTVALVREQRIYEDGLYRAVVSGVHPSLDTIAVFPQHSVITINTVNTVEGQKNRHWGLGVHGGYGVSGDGFTPYIGIGISYNILMW